jgi:uncharacterized membrane protein
METLYLAVVGIVLYFVADWLVDLSERVAGRRFANRTLLFFFVLLGLAAITFWALQRLLAPAVT